MPTPARLQERVAVVTGASRGVGHAIARRLAADGARVVLVARDGEALEDVAGKIRREGGQALPVAADVTDRAAMEAVAARTRENWGTADLLVANAGLLSQIGALWRSDPDGWWRDVEVNLRGSYLLCRVFLPDMVEAGRGRVVLFGGGGSTRPFAGATAYATAKAGMLRLAETLDQELDDTGVRCFAVSPGFVRTGMTEPFGASEEARRWLGFLADRLERGETTPPEACAELVARIGAGDLDGLHGRFLHAAQDLERLDELQARADAIADDDERVLVMRGFSL